MSWARHSSASRWRYTHHACAAYAAYPWLGLAVATSVLLLLDAALLVPAQLLAAVTVAALPRLALAGPRRARSGRPARQP